jgi:hypothetical protein
MILHYVQAIFSSFHIRFPLYRDMSHVHPALHPFPPQKKSVLKLDMYLSR